jgi:hypothetical protein
VSMSGSVAKVALRSAKDDRSLSYDMKLLDSAETQAELGAILFLMAQRALDFEKKLGQAEKRIESLRQSVNAASSKAGTSVFDITFEAKKKKLQQKPPSKQAGMSVINPGSKKRSKASGVEYD